MCLDFINSNSVSTENIPICTESVLIHKSTAILQHKSNHIIDAHQN